jgi:hypothetical protein
MLVPSPTMGWEAPALISTLIYEVSEPNLLLGQGRDRAQLHVEL